MKQLADLLVKPEDGRFARTIVNRLWARLMGRGIVEPLDDMDQPAWSQDLLDWLAADFVAHGHDLKHTLALIATSRAYRLPSVGVADPRDRGPFRLPRAADQADDRRAVRRRRLDGHGRLAAGVRRDGQGRRPGSGGPGRRGPGRDRGGREDGSGEVSPRRPRRGPMGLEPRRRRERPRRPRSCSARSSASTRSPKRALAVATCDNELVLYVNGQQVGQSSDWTKPIVASISRSSLKAGDNVIAVEATNWPDREARPRASTSAGRTRRP